MINLNNNLDYLSDILNFLKEKNFDKISEIIKNKNNTYTQKQHESKLGKVNEIVTSINNYNKEIELLEYSKSKIIISSEASEKSKLLITEYIKNLKREKNKLISMKNQL